MSLLASDDEEAFDEGNELNFYDKLLNCDPEQLQGATGKQLRLAAMRTKMTGRSFHFLYNFPQR